ncbi:LysR family transcriptional regulator substrate-binding protein [Nonomuraea sp. NPDC050153]|uniref:LysR family transcriptional regulator substrate-binding protein n=1 Tax=Nonomuraea sp. NPDC050153 TaxID=3364359 RepID=UPI0037925652
MPRWSRREAVTSGLCDLAVPIAPRIPYGRGLTGELVGHQDLVLTGRAGAAARVTAQELAALPFVSTPRASIRREIEDAVFAELGITDRNVVIEFGHPEAIKHAVRAGLGVALLFRASVAEDLAGGSLQEIRIADARPRLPIFTVWRADKRLSPLQRNLMTVIRDALSS